MDGFDRITHEAVVRCWHEDGQSVILQGLIGEYIIIAGSDRVEEAFPVTHLFIFSI